MGCLRKVGQQTIRTYPVCLLRCVSGASLVLFRVGHLFSEGAWPILGENRLKGVFLSLWIFPDHRMSPWEVHAMYGNCPPICWCYGGLFHLVIFDSYHEVFFFRRTPPFIKSHWGLLYLLNLRVLLSLFPSVEDDSSYCRFLIFVTPPFSVHWEDYSLFHVFRMVHPNLSSTYLGGLLPLLSVITLR